MTGKGRKVALAVGGVISLAAAGGLVWNSLQGDLSYFYTPSQVVAGAAPANAPLRVGGTVKPGSLRPRTAEAPATLRLADAGQEVLIEHAGEWPALLREGQEAVAYGRLVDGRLLADRLIPRFDDPLKNR
jgi:cytochrome c-type biogenesis protein CcmE